MRSYEAKGAGRGIARYFSSELQSEQDDRVQLETDLRQALGLKQFHLQFQPLVNAQTQKLVGFEALLRWNHPTRGLVPPFVFIPVAEEAGLMMGIGEWIVDEACRAAVDLARTDHRRTEHLAQAVGASGTAQYRQLGAGQI